MCVLFIDLDSNFMKYHIVHFFELWNKIYLHALGKIPPLRKVMPNHRSRLPLNT